MCHSSSSNETPERSHCIDKQTTKLTKSGYDKNDWIWKIKQWEAIATGNVYVDTFISAATFNETAVIWQNKKTGFLVGCCFIKRQNADVAFDSKHLCTRIFGLKNDRRVVVIRKASVWSYMYKIYSPGKLILYIYFLSVQMHFLLLNQSLLLCNSIIPFWTLSLINSLTSKTHLFLLHFARSMWYVFFLLCCVVCRYNQMLFVPNKTR